MLGQIVRGKDVVPDIGVRETLAKDVRVQHQHEERAQHSEPVPFPQRSIAQREERRTHNEPGNRHRNEGQRKPG